jgi:hypothetical protein
MVYRQNARILGMRVQHCSIVGGLQAIAEGWIRQKTNFVCVVGTRLLFLVFLVVKMPCLIMRFSTAKLMGGEITWTGKNMA